MDRGREGRGSGCRRGRRGRGKEEKDWIPVTKLGRLVKEGKIKSLEEIYLFSLPIKEPEIIDMLIGPALKYEVLKIMPIQKQTRAGQKTRFKAFVAIGDYNGHVGLGVKCSEGATTAIPGAIILAKLSIVPVRRGFWGDKIGRPHTVPSKVTGKCGSIWVRLIPAPRGTGIVSAPVPKKLLQMAGIDDCYTSARGSTGTLGNFVKATYDAIAATYAYLTPHLWKETAFQKSPYQEVTDFLSENHSKPEEILESFNQFNYWREPLMEIDETEIVASSIPPPSLVTQVPTLGQQQGQMGGPPQDMIEKLESFSQFNYWKEPLMEIDETEIVASSIPPPSLVMQVPTLCQQQGQMGGPPQDMIEQGYSQGYPQLPPPMAGPPPSMTQNTGSMEQQYGGGNHDQAQMMMMAGYGYGMPPPQQEVVRKSVSWRDDDVHVEQKTGRRRLADILEYEPIERSEKPVREWVVLDDSAVDFVRFAHNFQIN